MHHNAYCKYSMAGGLHEIESVASGCMQGCVATAGKVRVLQIDTRFSALLQDGMTRNNAEVLQQLVIVVCLQKTTTHTRMQQRCMYLQGGHGPSCHNRDVSPRSESGSRR